MSVPQSLDDLLKEIITDCDALRDDAHRRAGFWTGLDGWLESIDNHAARLRVGASNAFATRLGMPDPQAEQRPEAARDALLALHFGAPADASSRSARARLKACVTHLGQAISASTALSQDAKVRQRLELAKAKLLMPKDPPPPDAHLATIGLLVASYRALRDAAKRD